MRGGRPASCGVLHRRCSGVPIRDGPQQTACGKCPTPVHAVWFHLPSCWRPESIPSPPDANSKGVRIPGMLGAEGRAAPGDGRQSSPETREPLRNPEVAAPAPLPRPSPPLPSGASILPPDAFGSAMVRLSPPTASQRPRPAFQRHPLPLRQLRERKGVQDRLPRRLPSQSTALH